MLHVRREEATTAEANTQDWLHIIFTKNTRIYAIKDEEATTAEANTQDWFHLIFFVYTKYFQPVVDHLTTYPQNNHLLHIQCLTTMPVGIVSDNAGMSFDDKALLVLS